MKNANAIFYVSKYLQKIYEPLFKNKINKTIYYSIDTNLFSPKNADEKIFKKYTHVNSKIKIVNVMNYNLYEKIKLLPKIKIFIEKFIEKYNVSFYFIGKGKYFNNIRSMFKNEHIHFFGPLPRTTIAKILPLFDIFFYPSSLDCFPSAVLEACSSGLACISTSVGGIPEMIVDKKTGLLFRNLNQLDNSLRTLIENGKLRRKLGSNARKHMVNHFNHDVIGQKFIEEFIPLLKK